MTTKAEYIAQMKSYNSPRKTIARLEAMTEAEFAVYLQRENARVAHSVEVLRANGTFAKMAADMIKRDSKR